MEQKDSKEIHRNAGEILGQFPVRASLHFSCILQRAHMFLNQKNSIYTCFFYILWDYEFAFKIPRGKKNKTSQNDIQNYGDFCFLA